MVAVPAKALQVGQALRDQGVTDPGQLAAAIARAVPSAALVAGAAAQRVLSKTANPVAAVVAPVIAPVIAPVVDAAGVARDVAELPTRVLRWLTDPTVIVRVFYVVGGAALMLTALGWIATSAVGASKIINTVKKVGG